jgi:LacI family transcriptional regulator, gluconate utilization system Gnt-I transcriptional repressor
MKSRTPIMFDVARRAGVSSMTVSRAFRDPGSVSEETRRKIEVASAAINFIPDRMAGALRSGVSNIVAAIVPSLHNSKFNEMIQGLSDELSKHGLVLSIGDSGFSAAQEYRVASELTSLKLRGLVLVATKHSRPMVQQIQRARFPVVEVGDLIKRKNGLVVSFSNREAARVMTTHLISRGYNRILFATFPIKMSERAQSRHAGYREALARGGIQYDPGLVVEAQEGNPSGAAILARFLDSNTPIDAFFGTGDVLALGALIEARRRGLQIPRDLAIASFDDHEVCQITDPPLTSLKIPRYEIGRRAAKLIVDLKVPVLQASQQAIDLGFSLVARGST